MANIPKLLSAEDEVPPVTVSLVNTHPVISISIRFSQPENIEAILTTFDVSQPVKSKAVLLSKLIQLANKPLQLVSFLVFQPKTEGGVFIALQPLNISSMIAKLSVFQLTPSTTGAVANDKQFINIPCALVRL